MRAPCFISWVADLSLSKSRTFARSTRRWDIWLRTAIAMPIDPNRLFLAGDSAGSHISAQLTVAITEPAYAQALGIAPR